MVTKVETDQTRAYRPPNLLIRRFSSILLIALLYTASSPFQPFSWLMQINGGFLFDNLLSGIILFCALYFQWVIASLSASVLISLPTGGGTVIRDGRVDRATSTPIFLWRTDLYWPCALSEALLLVIAEWGPSEYLRRGIVALVVACLWGLGWPATPASYKRWAWEHIKTYLFVLILDEIRRTAYRGSARRSRGRW